MSQIHKKFKNEKVKELLEKYLKKEIERKYIQEILNIGKSRFFELVQNYRNNSKTFTIGYKRKGKTRSIETKVQENIIKI